VTPANVLWIYCDELRADALGCYARPGGLRPHTPVLDRLAREGVVFDHCYAASPVCVPSRTAALTGLPPERTGVYHNEAAAPGFVLPGAPVTFPEVFAAAGATTASFGKEHVPAALHPWQVDDGTGAGMRDTIGGADPASLLRSPGMGFVIGGEHAGEYPPDGIVRRASAFLAEVDRPFLLRASFLQPHTPVLPPRRWRERFDPADQPGRALGPGPADNAFERRFAALGDDGSLPDAELRRAQADYLACVAWVDEQVGLLLDALATTGHAGDTAVVVTADHGAHLGEGGAFGKHTFAPQSHRVPLVVHAPGRVAPARRADPACSTDLGRTLAGLAGVTLPDGFGGRDLFADPAPGHVLSTIGYGDPGSRAFPHRDAGTWTDGRGWPRRTCVRDGRFRLDATVRIDGAPAAPRDEDVFLCDSLRDPFEVHDLAGDPAHAEVRDRLLALVRARARDAVEPATTGPAHPLP
jgi:arylsulfatase A-like enzyme